jgi:branched-chain amino acid transport system substrate-binding protein
MSEKEVSRRKFLKRVGIGVAAAAVAAGVGYSIYQATAPAKKAEIVFGASLPLTGALAEFGTVYEQVFKAWQEYVNGKGGILGRQVRFIIYNDDSKPETCSSNYEKLITVDKVDVIIGAYGTLLVMAASAVTEKYKYVHVSTAAIGRPLYARGLKYLFHILPTEGPNSTLGTFKLIENVSADQKPKSAAIIYVDNLLGIEIAEGATNFCKQYGIDVTTNEKYPGTLADFVPLITKVKATGADTLICGSYPPDSYGILRACSALNYKPRILWEAIGVSDPAFYQKAGGDAANGVLSFSFWVPNSAFPETDIFIDTCKKKNIIIDWHSAGGWAACQLMKIAIEKTGSTDNTVLRDYIANNVNNTIMGPIDYQQYKLNGVYPGAWGGALPQQQWQNGKYVTVWPADVAETKWVYPRT